MRTMVLAMALTVLPGLSLVSAQSTEDAIKQQLEAFSAAWNKGDAPALAALWDMEAVAGTPDGSILGSRAAIEKYFAEHFAGEWKGTTITLTHHAAKELAPNIAISHGGFEVHGAAAPLMGHYVDTWVKKDGQWLVVASQAAAKPPA